MDAAGGTSRTHQLLSGAFRLFRDAAVERVRAVEPLRLVAVAGLGIGFVFTMGIFLGSTRTEASASAEQPVELALVADESVEASAQDPSYRSFRVAMGSRVHTVQRLDADDSQTRSGAAPIDLNLETDLFPPYSLAGRPSVGPGLYATRFGVKECSFELRRLKANGIETVIGHDRLVGGRMLATVHDIEADIFDPSPSCGDWSVWSPVTTPLSTAGTGDYWRDDLRRGVWNISRGCEWEKVVGFRGADLADVQDSGMGPGQLIIDDQTLGLRVRRCSGGLIWREPVPPRDDS